MDTLGLALRVGLSLACVLGLIWLFSKGLLKAPGTRLAQGSSLRLLGRQQLSRNASVAVIGFGDRALVLGVTEQGVTLLSEATAEELGSAPEAAPPRRTSLDPATLGRPGTVDAVPRQRVAAQGSALSPHTWAQALEVVRERTTRR